jgi:hypothetical protein
MPLTLAATTRACPLTGLNRHPPDDRLFRSRLTPGRRIGKREPRRDRPDGREAGKIDTLRAGNCNLVLAKAQLSLGFAGTP